ncbi:hypothetical protein [Elizabethkingia anophelis]|uniref:hypothetical protein n=1 Tax=Elizabethkingia anophelis TaxID=1117645 RepID=UPI002010FF83|nr:hypothetical protein [Elizabethkingia anophelis]MCL1692037.1 hypothetical protein [Elizabethkingia anophelis]
MEKVTEHQKFKILYEILEEARKQANYNDNSHVQLKISIKDSNDNDTEIFIRKGLKIYAFRVYDNEGYTFYERWNKYPGRIFTKKGLLDELIILLRNQQP